MSIEFPARVTLREVAPRDGLQNVADFVPTTRKVELIRAAAAAGLREIEVTSCVSEKVIPQMRDAREVLGAVTDLAITRAVLAPTPNRAREAVDAGADQLIVFLSASEAHNRANVNRSVDESLTGLEPIARIAGDAGVPVTGAIAVSFGCPYEGEVPIERVVGIAARFVDLGAQMIVFGDTVGMATPPRVEKLIAAFRERLADTPFSLHFHNNRGTAMTNLYAALAAGATVFDTALGGVGGCPTVPQAAGNLATEDVVYLLDALGVESGVDLERAIEAARLLERFVGCALPGQVMKSGPAGRGAAAGASA